jgi:4-hydroxybenzoate polyprenyltransferase
VAPAGAWIAATGRLALPPLLLGAGVVGWVAGFDLIYATQDYEFDRREGLHSLVVRLGLADSLRLAQCLHFFMFLALLAFGYTASLGLIYFCGMPLVAGALIYEHRSAARLDLAAVNRAFFQSNAFVGAIYLISVLAAVNYH